MATFAYNIGHHRSTGKSLFQLLYGRKPGLPAQLYPKVMPSSTMSTNQYLQKLIQTLIQLQTEAYATNLGHKKYDVDKSTEQFPPLNTYNIDDMVYYYSNQGYGREYKLSNLWYGPMKVIQKVSPYCYTLKDIKNGDLISWVHAQYMRPVPLKT